MDPSETTGTFLGCNVLLISPINMMALICRTANGLESDFFEITYLWDIKQ